MSAVCTNLSWYPHHEWEYVDLAGTEKVQVISDHINHSVFLPQETQARYYLRKFCPMTLGEVDKNASKQWCDIR